MRTDLRRGVEPVQGVQRGSKGGPNGVQRGSKGGPKGVQRTDLYARLLHNADRSSAWCGTRSSRPPSSLRTA
eukprot:1039259-Prorocentrum_minimum.AAC.1